MGLVIRFLGSYYFIELNGAGLYRARASACLDCFMIGVIKKAVSLLEHVSMPVVEEREKPRITHYRR